MARQLDALQHVGGLAGGGEREQAVAVLDVGEIAVGRRVLATSDDSDLAISLAIGTLAEGRSPAQVMGLGDTPSSARVRQLAERIFGTHPGTIVVLGPAQ